MPTLFDDAWSVAAGVLDAHFGEEFELTLILRVAPGQRVDVNAPKKPDPAQEPVVFTGIWGTRAVERFPDSRGHASSDAQSFTAALASVEFEASGLPVAPRAGDRVKRIATGDTYEIVDAGSDVLGRRTLKLTARRSA